MIHHLAAFLDPDSATWLRLFHRYVSTRAGFAFLTALLIVGIGFPGALRVFLRLGWVNRQRSYMGDGSGKEGVPVMGGILIFAGATLSVLAWCDLTDPFVAVALAASVWFFWLGFQDDLSKIRGKDHDAGLSRATKYLGQGFFGLALGVYLCSPMSPHPELLRGTLHIPLLKQPFHIGWLQIPFIVFAVIFITNAVNFSDGMDGLATAPSFMTFLGLGIFAYIMGHKAWAQHFLFFDFGPGGHAGIACSELVVLCSALMGALLGFLWYNTYPAQVFMGDCGSMYLGGLMASIFVVLKQELLFPAFGFLFLLEVVSVIIQDWIGIQWLGRRIFFRAPFHEDLKYRGWSEPKIVVRLWILSGVAMSLGLLTIKLR